MRGPLLSLSLLLVATTSSAEPAPVSLAQVSLATFDALPVGHLHPLVSQTMPASVPAEERVPGVSFAPLPSDDVDGGDDDPSPCIVDVSDDDLKDDPSSGGDSSPGMSLASYRRSLATDAQPKKVELLRIDRVTNAPGGSVVLDAAQAWFDERTRGARLLSRTNVTLAPLFHGPNGAALYGARDGEQAILMLRIERGPSPEEEALRQLESKLGPPEVLFTSGRVLRTDCRELLFTLKAGRGQAVSVAIPLLAMKPGPKFSSPREPSILQVDCAGDDCGGLHFSPDVGNLWNRSYRVTVSLSQTLSDPRPVLSLGAGWAGRARPGLDGVGD